MVILHSTIIHLIHFNDNLLERLPGVLGVSHLDVVDADEKCLQTSVAVLFTVVLKKGNDEMNITVTRCISSPEGTSRLDLADTEL